MAASGEAHRTEDKPAWLVVAPALFLLFWSGGFAVAKIGIAYADPLTLLALRYGLVLLVLLPLFVILRPPLPRTRADWGHLAFIGLLIQAIYFGLAWYGFSLGISAGLAALIIAMQPLLVAALAPRFVGEAVSPMRWAGLGLGLAGAAIVILARSRIEAEPLLGILLTVCALMAMVTATLYEKRFGVSHHPVTSNFVQYAVSFPAVLMSAWLLEPMRVDWTFELGAALAYLVVCNSLIALTLLLAMIRHGEASRVSALFYLVPPCAAVIAWMMLGEEMPLLAWLGMAVAGAGVMLVSRTAPRASKS